MGANASIAATPEWNDTALALAVREADLAAIEARVQAKGAHELVNGAAHADADAPQLSKKTTRADFECRSALTLIDVSKGRGQRGRNVLSRTNDGRIEKGGAVATGDSGW